MALLYRMGSGNGSGGDLKPYIVQFTCDSGYIGQTLTMTYKGTPHAGETVDNVSGTVASDGTLTLYPMHSGNWECSCYSSVTGTTMKKTIELSYWGTTNVEFNDTPDGATVTPTDDVQTWLHCANIWDKQYTTVSQVVADKTTLNALVQNENANDYLVRSTTFSTTLCENNANNEAMYYLGLYDGCANKLLADDYWRDAICNADVLLADGQTHLFEKVLNVKVPRMESNTKPSGECKASSVLRNEESFYPFRAFDDVTSGTLIWVTNASPTGWISYSFTKKIKVLKFKSNQWIDNYSSQNAKTVKIQYSDDGNNYLDAGSSYTLENQTKDQSYVVTPSGAHRHWRLNILENYGDPNNVRIESLQFYGREEV